MIKQQQKTNIKVIINYLHLILINNNNNNNNKINKQIHKIYKILIKKHKRQINLKQKYKINWVNKPLSKNVQILNIPNNKSKEFL